MSEDKTIFKTISEQLIGLAQKIGQVFELGRKAEYDAFWDEYQQNGTRTNYTAAFRTGWNDKIFRPKYNLVGGERTFAQVFMSSEIEDLKGICERQGIIIDTSACVTLLQLFQSSSVKYIPALDIRNANNNTNYAFSSDSIITIDKLLVSENTIFATSMFDAPNLESVIFEGVIGQGGLDLSKCNKLSHESLISVINCLKDGVSGLTCTLGATNLAKLTLEEKMIAINKGWDIGVETVGFGFYDVGTTTYHKFIEGMTWAQWCDSAYNTLGWYISDWDTVYNGVVGIKETDTNLTQSHPGGDTLINKNSMYEFGL